MSGVVPIPVSYSGLSSLSILAGNQGNLVTVHDTPAQVPVYINTGSGLDRTTVLRTSYNLTIEGQDSADEVTLGTKDQFFDNGFVIQRTPGTPAYLGGTLTINNQKSLSQLTLEDTANSSYRTVGMSMSVAPLGLPVSERPSRLHPRRSRRLTFSAEIVAINS